MAEERNWKRIRERLALQLPVRVYCRETPDFEWSEVTRLINVTPFGAGFTIKRPTERGRLLRMTIPMPRQLRVFDHVEDQYRIWAIVRYLLNKTTDKAPVFEIGVAFIGKRPPASYESQPWKRYEISTSASENLAVIDETLEPAPRGDARSHTRHNIAVDMQVELMDENGAVIASEQTVTENISLQGASLFTTLEIPVGRFIRITSAQYRVTVFAAIRSRSKGADGVPRIHVEFVDRQWPL
ncbi:MAG TPA: PilZ domain-containing protein [Pyrinomonadaceae bacterium]|nr:PilZ domain-containing protein [Pyrinomonadaceae bacterium]